MSNMNDIMREFKNKVEYKRKEWKTIIKSDKNTLANDIIRSIKSYLKTDEQDKESRKNAQKQSIDFRQEYKVSVVKNNERTWIYRQEEGLERLICILNNKHDKNGWGNQIIINKKKCSKKENVDLVEYDKKTNDIISLIELKASNGNDSPLRAIIELLKNYFLCDIDNRQHIKNLILLAPKDYYVKHQIRGNKDFKTLIDELKRQLKVNIEIKEINLSNKDWEIIENEMLLTSNLEFTASKPNPFYEEQTPKDKGLDISECVEKNLFSGMDDYLKKQWKSVKM